MGWRGCLWGGWVAVAKAGGGEGDVGRLDRRVDARWLREVLTEVNCYARGLKPGLS